jgi:hypothetical protein
VDQLHAPAVGAPALLVELGHRHTLEADDAQSRCKHTGDDPGERRLAAPTLADEAHDLALV